MRMPTLILSLTTVTFAATTGWLAWELHQRDADRESIGAPLAAGALIPANGRAPIAGALARVPATQSPGTASPASVPLPAPEVGGAATRGKPNLSQDPSVMYARQFLARYDDSAQRQAQLEEARAGVRRQYAQLKEQLGLSDEKFEQIVDVIAQSNLQGQEVWARCAVDADCDSSRPHPELVEDRSQELLALLGPGQIDAFNRYRSALGERDSVASFRGRLSDAQFLPQAQAEQLIEALSQERERYSQEMQQSGAAVRGWGTNLGMVMYPESANTAEAQLAAALQYSERMRARAATVLTPAQLAAFVQMQEELLAQLALFVRPTPPRKANALKLAQG